jgi:hypothetical protein
MFPIAGFFDEKFFELLAQSAGAVALWASARGAQHRNEVADLTERLRHPVRWTMRNPVRAFARLATDRRQGSVLYPESFKVWASRMRGEWETLTPEERSALFATWLLWGKQ